MFGLVVLLVGATSPLHAQGEHGRRAGAEVRVLAGDVREIVRLDGSDALIASGLEHRIRGSLASLAILLRLADQEVDRTAPSHKIPIYYEYVNQSKWRELTAQLTQLENAYPLERPYYVSSKKMLEAGRKLHSSLCAGCHDQPARVERPAYNLFDQAAKTSGSEFYARMLVGVRGDRITGIDNPFTDSDLAALIYFYEAGQ